MDGIRLDLTTVLIPHLGPNPPLPSFAKHHETTKFKPNLRGA